jgi:hypothetical protein
MNGYGVIVKETDYESKNLIVFTNDKYGNF